MDHDLTKLTVDMEYLKETVDRIESKLEDMDLGSRLAVLEDRQKLLFKMFFGGLTFGGTLISGILIWLVTQ